MFEVILTGLGYGLLLSVMVGPAFFILIETSIRKGIKSALFFDLGVLISDLIYLSIAYVFFSEVTALMEGNNSFWLKIVGGSFFIILGIVDVSKRRPKTKFSTQKQMQEMKNARASNHFVTLLKGTTFNLLNPGVLFYWLTLMSILPEAPARLGLERQDQIAMYIVIILITFFSIDVLKIFGAKKLKDILTPLWMRNLNLALGIVLICFGTLFLTQGIIGYYR
ncbi:MAG: LysE family transporter [Crocinitomicaceae bacterium]